MLLILCVLADRGDDSQWRIRQSESDLTEMAKEESEDNVAVRVWTATEKEVGLREKEVKKASKETEKKKAVQRSKYPLVCLMVVGPLGDGQ